MILFLDDSLRFRRKNMEETVICKLCLEPIFNFICIDCLGGTVKRWLTLVKPKLLKGFSKFHEQLFNYFSSFENQERCMKCNNVIDTVICPYCYEKEVFWWLFPKDVKLSNMFAKLFNFDFFGPGYLPTIKTRNLEPIVIVDKKNKSDLNICENCGQVSDNLKKENESWFCETCIEM